MPNATQRISLQLAEQIVDLLHQSGATLVEQAIALVIARELAGASDSSPIDPVDAVLGSAPEEAASA